MRRFLSDHTGNVILTFGLVGPVLVLAAGIAIDFSDGAREKSKLQAAADAAALTGARVLSVNYSKPAALAEAAATQAAEQFVVANATAGAAPSIKASAPDKTVDVKLTVAKRMAFGGVIGQSVLNIDASATGTYQASFKPCMLALGSDEPIGIELVGAAKINAHKCAVESNAKSGRSIVTQGAAKITAGKVCAAGDASRAKTTPPAEKCDKVEDPLAGNMAKAKITGSTGSTSGSAKSVVSSAYTGPCLERDKSIGASSKETQKLSPGVYCGGLSIQSADVELAPGLYQIQDGPLSLQANANLSGQNVTILLSGTGAVLDLQGSPKLILTAPTTGPYAGMAIVSDTPAIPILTSKMQGSPDIKVTGTIYLPNQRLEMQGSATIDIVGLGDTLIALSFKLQGSPDINIKSDFSAGNSSVVRLLK